MLNKPITVLIGFGVVVCILMYGQIDLQMRIQRIISNQEDHSNKLKSIVNRLEESDTKSQLAVKNNSPPKIEIKDPSKLQEKNEEKKEESEPKNKEKTIRLVQRKSSNNETKEEKSAPQKVANNTGGKIPKVIYQTAEFSEDKIPKFMKSAMNSVKERNPGYEYRYFDDAGVEKFFVDNFGENGEETVALRTLVAGAFKADLFRYCILYLYGGIYVDADMVVREPFDEWLPFEASVVVPKDRTPCALFQAFIAAQPKSPLFRIAIDDIIKTTKERSTPSYPKNKICPTGKTDLTFTGPFLLMKCLNRFLKKPDDDNYTDKDYLEVQNIRFIKNCFGELKVDSNCKGRVVIKNKYPEYPNEMERTSKKKRYSAKDVFADPPQRK